MLNLRDAHTEREKFDVSRGPEAAALVNSEEAILLRSISQQSLIADTKLLLAIKSATPLLRRCGSEYDLNGL